MCRKSYLLAFVFIIVFVGLIMTDSSADYVCGDANGDGLLNVSDAVFIINHVFIGGPAPDPGCCGGNCPPTVIDYDGNVYQTVQIGDQCWMKQNLKVTHYRNGEPIPNVTDDAVWEGLTTGAYCDYNNDPSNVAMYGRLYNWYVVNDSRGLPPEGWHVPSDAEWKQLEMYLGMSQEEADGFGLRGTDEGGKLKEAGTAHWMSPNAGATNESGFSALPSGYRWLNGNFEGMGNLAYFWSSTEQWSGHSYYRGLRYDYSSVDRYNYNTQGGFSVRCVRD